VDVASGAYVATAPETAVSALFLVLDVLQVVLSIAAVPNHNPKP